MDRPRKMLVGLLVLAVAVGLAILSFRLPGAIREANLLACGRKVNGDTLAISMDYPEFRSAQVPHDANRIKGLAGIETVTPMAISHAEVRSSDGTSSAMLRLLELTKETTVRLGLSQLELRGPPNRPQIAIGQLLAAQLGVHTGALIVVATHPTDASRGVTVECFVRDIIDLGCDHYNAHIVIADINTSDTFGLTPESIAVWFKNQSETPSKMDDLSRELGLRYELDPLDKTVLGIQ